MAGPPLRAILGGGGGFLLEVGKFKSYEKIFLRSFNENFKFLLLDLTNVQVKRDMFLHLVISERFS